MKWNTTHTVWSYDGFLLEHYFFLLFSIFITAETQELHVSSRGCSVFG